MRRQDGDGYIIIAMDTEGLSRSSMFTPRALRLCRDHNVGDGKITVEIKIQIKYI